MEAGEDPVRMLGDTGGGHWVAWDPEKDCATAVRPGDTQLEHKPPNTKKLGKTTLKTTKKLLCQTWPVQWAPVHFWELSLLGWLKGSGWSPGESLKPDVGVEVISLLAAAGRASPSPADQTPAPAEALWPAALGAGRPPRGCRPLHACSLIFLSLKS